MGRKKKSVNRPVSPDPKYNSTVVSKFVNRMMWEGKRSVSLAIIHGAFDVLKTKEADKDPLEVFLKALENVKPLVEVKSRRVGGATYQVPIEIRESRREALGMRWLINAARARSGRGMGERLAAEMLEAYNSTGTAFKKKEDTHRMAEANKAFAHYRW
jgi:small subunit ribosomal protein S7